MCARVCVCVCACVCVSVSVSASCQVYILQELDRHVKAPLSNSKSTRNTRQALETNGKFAVKTGI